MEKKWKKNPGKAGCFIGIFCIKNCIGVTNGVTNGVTKQRLFYVE
jgi:hypothetical protein